MAEQATATTTKKVSATIGVFIALVYNGMVLLIRRAQEQSIIPGASFYGNWELPGGAVEEGDEGKGYDGVVQAAMRKFAEKTGSELWKITSSEPGIFYPIHTALFKGPNGYDLAGVLAYSVHGDVFDTLQGDGFEWVDANELNKLARDFISATDAKKQGLPSAVGIVSGWGKRMHCMALCALEEEAKGSSQEIASDTLREITATWR